LGYVQVKRFDDRGHHGILKHLTGARLQFAFSNAVCCCHPQSGTRR
jgi:hypothetical protein